MSHYKTPTCFGTEVPLSGSRSVQRNVVTLSMYTEQTKRCLHAPFYYYSTTCFGAYADHHQVEVLQNHKGM
jgi:hypothetical protein